MITRREIINDIYCWNVIHHHGISVDNMTEQELNEAIIEDVLISTIRNYNLTWIDLFRFLLSNNSRINRVLNAIVNDTVYSLINIDDNDIIRIRPECLQFAMDICGTWFEGYDIPEGVNIVSLTDYGRNLIETIGIENVILSTSMDLISNIEITSNSIN